MVGLMSAGYLNWKQLQSNTCALVVTVSCWQRHLLCCCFVVSLFKVLFCCDLTKKILYILLLRTNYPRLLPIFTYDVIIIIIVMRFNFRFRFWSRQRLRAVVLHFVYLILSNFVQYGDVSIFLKFSMAAVRHFVLFWGKVVWKAHFCCLSLIKISSWSN